jgi:hypothetical protein
MGVDLRTGSGLDHALRGADTVVDTMFSMPVSAETVIAALSPSSSDAARPLFSLDAAHLLRRGSGSTQPRLA